MVFVLLHALGLRSGPGAHKHHSPCAQTLASLDTSRACGGRFGALGVFVLKVILCCDLTGGRRPLVWLTVNVRCALGSRGLLLCNVACEVFSARVLWLLSFGGATPMEGSY